MKRVVYGRDIKAVDRRTIEEIGIPSMVLMERAAYSCLPYLEDKEKILVVAGTGNNGADGIALARMLYLKGKQVEIFIVGSGSGSSEWQLQMQIVKNLGISFVTTPDFSAYDSIVDAIFGVGLSRAVTGVFAEVISEINAQKHQFILAIDMPSGIDSNTGAILGTAVHADQTVTFGSMKSGLLLYPGAEYGGTIAVEDIGFPEDAYQNLTNLMYYGLEDLYSVMPIRPAHSNKGDYGKVLVVAGSRDMSGACYLCAAAAYKSGAGIVRILTEVHNRTCLQEMLPEAILSTYDDTIDEAALQEALDWAGVIVAGPGLGQSQTAVTLVKAVLCAGKPTILDADGLNILAKHSELTELLHKQIVLTPHLGEMSRLCGKSIGEIQDTMLETVLTYAKNQQLTCVLKDAHTIAADWNQNVYINTDGNAGMAKGGSGDVLAGVLGAMAGNRTIGAMPEYSGNPLFTKVVLGVALHSKAGDAAAGELGTYAMTARDIIGHIKEILR